MQRRFLKSLIIGLCALSFAIIGQDNAQAKTRLKRYTFGSLLLRVSVPTTWTKVAQTSKKVKFKSSKRGHSLTILRKFGAKNIHSVAEGVKRAWRAKGWTIAVDKRGKLKGTNHAAMIIRAHHRRAKASIAFYAVKVGNRIYAVTFGNKSTRFKPKLYNKIMLTFDAI